MATLPVREMVLYKHGVGFFVRRGRLSGDSVELTFRHDEINDVLKSLAVLDSGDGQVLGIHYPTPMDVDARLANTSIRLSDTASLRDLLSSLRGRDVELEREIVPGLREAQRGRMIGMDDPSAYSSMSHADMPIQVTLLGEDGQVRILPFNSLRTLRILDPQADHDLIYFLDTSAGDGSRRSVQVRLSAGEHDLTICYTAPSPVWRVSYRLIAESDPSRAQGKALLQGWGLIDNRLEEDLESVSVSLVAGQPISFIYDLYSSTIPERPRVRDEARIAPGPIAYEGDFRLQESDMDQPGFQRRASAKAAMPASVGAGGMLLERERGVTRADAQASFLAQTETKDSGEFFQYTVVSPVSIKRGESALVPIISEELSYTRELLYNREKLAGHPVAALRFANATGVTLERGPVTLVEDDDYRGEAVIPFSREGSEVYLPYAVELGVRVTESPSFSHHTVAISFRGDLMIHQQYRVRQTVYTLENRTAKPQSVIIEETVDPSDEGELFETAAPFLEMATGRRWRVEVRARASSTFVVRERFPAQRQELLRQLDHEKLRGYLAQRWLDQGTFDTLAELIAAMGEAQRAHERRSALEAERASMYAQQEHLRVNLASLQAVGPEAALRQRVLAQFEALQDRLDGLDVEDGALRTQAAAAEARAQQIMDMLPQTTE